MELPIQIIVILFVALVVGGAIIAFSQNTLRNAQQQLNDKFKNDPANKDVVVEVDHVTDQTLINLANECVKRNVGTVDKKLCFALFQTSGNTWDITLLGRSDIPLDNPSFNMSTTGVQGVFTALKFTYDPSGKVLVTN